MEVEPVVARKGLLVSLLGNYLVPILVAICALFVLKVFMDWLRRYMILKKMRGPNDAFPPQFLIDSIVPRLATRAKDVTYDITSILMDVLEKYPDPQEGICKIYLGFTPMVLLSRAESAEAILTDNINITKPLVYTFIDKYIPKSLLTSTGDFWRFQRKLLTPAFHFKILDDFMGIFNKHSANLAVHLRSMPAGEEIRLFREMSKCTMNVIGETSLGHDVNAMATENFYGKALTMVQTLAMFRSFRPWMWIDWIYFKTFEGGLLQRAIDTMHQLSARIIDIKLAERKEADLKASQMNGNGALPVPARKKVRTFIEIMLDSHTQNPSLVKMDMIQSGVDTMLFAGQDTTATSSAWTMFLLGHSLDIQEKCRKELFKVLGPDPTSHVTSEHLKQLKYLDAVVKESMRIYAPIPLFGRQVDHDIKVKGNGRTFTIPAGVQVFTSIFHVHRDPRYYPDPEKFDPERFLDENAPHKAHPFSYIPFSGGPRNCIGQKFAIMELKVIMAHVLRNFKWTSTRPRDQLRLVFEIVLRAQGDLRIKLEPLNPEDYVEIKT